MDTNKSSQPPVVGRFAPSPTGPLHFGTLIAALGSYLAAKAGRGTWRIRIEDLDLPRVVEGSAASLLSALDRLGFEWDGTVVYQSRRFQRYRDVLEQLREGGWLFDCTCSRREILASAPHPGEEGPVYPGTCRNGPRGNRAQRAVRLRVDGRPIRFCDRVFGDCVENLEKQTGDFVLHRADGVFAYQLAVVVDDIDSGVTQVVRGADLLSSTARQIYLYRLLGAVVPDYLHLPLALGKNGEKLSKRDGAELVVGPDNGSFLLWRALAFLGQAPPEEALGCAPAELLRWGLDNFRSDRIPRKADPFVFSEWTLSQRQIIC